MGRPISTDTEWTAIDKALQYVDAKDYPEAIRVLERMIEDRPGPPPELPNASNILLGRAYVGQAVKELTTGQYSYAHATLVRAAEVGTRLPK
jgi:hypothetical protein